VTLAVTGILCRRNYDRLQVHQKVMRQRLFPDKIILKKHDEADSELEYDSIACTKGRFGAK